MHRNGIIDILNKLESDIPPGLRRYKLVEQLQKICYPANSSGFFPFSLINGFRRRSGKGAGQRDARVRSKCCKCGYEVKGLESPLGPDIPVGPKVCPECGTEYPAIW